MLLLMDLNIFVNYLLPLFCVNYCVKRAFYVAQFSTSMSADVRRAL